jgi:hypothetical protein
MTEEDEPLDHFFDEFIGEVGLDSEGNVMADIYTGLDVGDNFTIELDELLEALEEIGGTLASTRELDTIEIIPAPPDFDPNDPEIRGPFPDLDTLLQFLDETGLSDIGEIIQSGDEFFVKVGSP